MIDIDVNKVADIIRHVSDTIVMPAFKNLRPDAIRQKKPGDFVTDADEASEKALSAALKEYLPGSLVVGEESVAKDKAVLELLKDSRPVWIIDPIDGTRNYTEGREHFGILVALVQNDVTQYGWAYDAPGDRMAIAVKGQGATINGVPAHIRTAAETPAEMHGMGGGAAPRYYDKVRAHFAEVTSLGSSLHDFLNIAAGHADFVSHLNMTTPWDHSASVLLAQEAGAYVRMADTDTDFTPSTHRQAIILAAADRRRWEMLRSILYPLMMIP